MGLYPKKVGQRFKNPRYAGKPQLTNATGTEATFICGAVVKLSLNIEPDTKEITGGGFQTSGCGYLIAAADVLIEKTVGHKLTVEEIGEFCNAGTGCGSCQPLIREIIDGCADIFN